MKRTAFALISIALFTGINSQAATAVAPNCGSFGANIEAGYCTMAWYGDVMQPTNGTFTYPEGASDLQAIIVGAGSGAYNSPNFDGPPFTTYSGNAGKIRYADLSEVARGTEISIVAARGGEKGPWSTAGGASSVSYGTTTLIAAGGAVTGAADIPCVYSYSFAGYTYTHPGSARQGSSALADSVVNSDGTCGALAVGVDPTTDKDSYGNEPLSMFDSSKTPLVGGAKLAKAGAIEPTVDGMAQEFRVSAPGIGDGGNMAIELRTTLNEPGGSTMWLGRLKEASFAGVGAVFFRWVPGSASENTGEEENANSGGSGSDNAPTLADTGTDPQLTWVASALIATGFALLLFASHSRRKVTRIRKH